MAPKMKYGVPISLWLVENSHRTGFVVKLRLCRFLPYQRGAPRRSGASLKGGSEGGSERAKVRKALKNGVEKGDLSPFPLTRPPFFLPWRAKKAPPVN
ncbi:unnamed protein product [Victoria cruziana]